MNPATEPVPRFRGGYRVITGGWVPVRWCGRWSWWVMGWVKGWVMSPSRLTAA